jgi:glyoxylase-like metal-dependent hydrolase (beta-lactamase superfamily II)
MDLKTIKVGAEKTNCYIVSEKSGISFVVDPGNDFESINGELKKIKNLDLKYILLTHGHFDHVQAVDDLKSAYPKADVMIGEGDIEFIRRLTEQGMYVGKFLKNVKAEIVAVSDGDFLPFGDGNIKVIGTPGHTPGGNCYLFDKILFSGDTLFWHTIGRTNLPLASESELKISLRKLATLPGETKVFPGHGKETIIKEEIINGYLGGE